MRQRQSGLGAVPRPPAKEIADYLYGKAAQLVALLQPLPSIEKPTAFLRWADSLINDWAIQNQMRWTAVLRPTAYVAQIGAQKGETAPIVGGASAADHAELLEQARQAGYNIANVQAYIVQLDVRNTFYPATMADFTTFLDELDAVLGHELIHVAQNIGARRTANERKSDLFRIMNAPFDCRSLPGPMEPHVVPCYAYAKGKRRITGYGIPVGEAGSSTQQRIAYPAMRQYLSGPEERAPYAYSIASALVAAGLTTLPEFPDTSEPHLNACTDLRMLARYFDYPSGDGFDVWTQIRRQALVYMRQLLDASKAADRAVAKSVTLRARREALIARRRGVQRVMQAPRVSAVAPRSSMIELD